MTLKELEEKLDSIQTIKSQFDRIKEALIKESDNYKSLSEICSYFMFRLKEDNNFDYVDLENFINREYKKLIETYVRKSN